MLAIMNAERGASAITVLTAPDRGFSTPAARSLRTDGCTQRMKQRLTIALLLVLLASGGRAHANFRDGLLAYQKKDYAKAFSEFESLAKLGHAQSQYMLGALYSRGEGASANLFLAYGWMKLAAEGGHENARRALPGLRAHMAEESVGAAERLLGEYSPAALDKRLGSVDIQLSHTTAAASAMKEEYRCASLS